MFDDKILKALSPSKDVLLLAVNATQTVNESMRRIKAYPPSMLHLGRAMMSALLLQSLSDSDEAETISLQWIAKGPFGGLFAEARGQGHVRGTIDNPQAAMDDLSTRLGPGILQVRRAHPNPNVTLGSSGHVEARGEVGEDLVEYLEKSEQRHCGMHLYVKIKYNDELKDNFPFEVEKAVGYLVHILPGENNTASLATIASWDALMKDLGPLNLWLWDESLDPALQILQFLTAKSEPDIRVESKVSFACTCSEDRASRALALANKLDPLPDDPLSKVDKAVIKCEFCGLVYEIPLPGELH